MRPTDRQMLHDYAISRERLRKPDTRGLINDYLRGILAASLAVLAAWILWQITGGIVAYWIGGY